LAIYGHGDMDARELSDSLTSWYFSESGGLMMTWQCREFYFALQDLLRSVAGIDGWRWERRRTGVHEEFRAFLRERGLEGAEQAVDYLEQLDRREVPIHTWRSQGPLLAKGWRDNINEVPGMWDDLTDVQRFTVLQGVSSQLRSCMVMDVESRAS
jgi:hypothetical protein